MTRKRRTREHVIEEMGVNFLERQVLRRGHQLQRPSLREYGWDAVMFHFSDDGQIETGEVRFQVKATDHLDVHANGIRCRLKAADIRYWYWETCPFILVLYDAARDRGYWLDIQDYTEQHPQILTSQSKTVTTWVPEQNKVTLAAIDQWRRLSCAFGT